MGRGTPKAANPQRFSTSPPKEFTQFTHSAYIISTSIIMLRIGLGLLKNLHDLVKAFILPRIFPVDLVRTYGK